MPGEGRSIVDFTKLKKKKYKARFLYEVDILGGANQ